MGGEVARAKGRARTCQIGTRLAGERAGVRGVRTIFGENPQRLGKVRQTHHLACAPRSASWTEGLCPVAVVAEDPRRPFDRTYPAIGCWERVGQVDGRREQVGPGEPAEAGVGIAPRAD